VVFLSQCNSDDKYASMHISGNDVYEGGEGRMSLQLACKNLAKVNAKHLKSPGKHCCVYSMSRQKRCDESIIILKLQK